MSNASQALDLFGRVRNGDPEAWLAVQAGHWFEPEGSLVSVGGLLSGMVGLTLSRIFDVDAEARRITNVLAVLLNERKDLASHLPLRVAQAFVRAAINDDELVPFVSAEISLENIVALLVLLVDHLSMDDEEVSEILDEVVSRTTGSPFPQAAMYPWWKTQGTVNP